MMTAAEWTAIAEACERATGPDREIDARIGAALDVCNGLVSIREWRHLARSLTTDFLPAYTASLDAITAAIEARFPDWRWSAECRDSPKGKAIGEGYIHNNELFMSGVRKSFDVFAATPALALCAAFALAMAAKARSDALSELAAMDGEHL